MSIHNVGVALFHFLHDKSIYGKMNKPGEGKRVGGGQTDRILTSPIRLEG